MKSGNSFGIALVILLIFGFSISYAIPKDSSFLVDGPNYIAEASGKGQSEAEAQNDALGNAISVIMESLNKDRLFEELFKKNMPLTMSWKKMSSEKGLAGWTVKLRLTVDDESLRLLYNTAYISSVSNMLDGAEKYLQDAERLARDAKLAETDGQIGRALSLYWQSRDSCAAGLELLKNVEDAAVFSTQGKKKAPELRDVLSTIMNSSMTGYERVQTAGRGLAEDEELKSAMSALEKIEKEASDMEAWSGSLADKMGMVEGMPKAQLKAISDELANKRRILDDSRLALSRVEDSIPKSKELVKARIDIARRRIDSLSSYFKTSKTYVDREIRDPAIARAKRSQNLRWALLHEPKGILSIRFYTPFAMDLASKSIEFKDSGLFEFELAAEQAFGDYQGIWIASSFKKQDYPHFYEKIDDDPMAGFVKSSSFSQNLDLGYFKNTMFGAGISWDWIQLMDGDTLEKDFALRALFGKVDGTSKLSSFLAVLSWEIPHKSDDFIWRNYLNLGTGLSARLGRVVELAAGAEYRLRDANYGYFDSLLMYHASIGFRLPSPFLWGLEVKGYSVSPVEQSGKNVDDIFLRFFFEYSL